MKQFIILMLALFWSAPIYADCTGSGLSIFPNGETIKQNSIFVLDGYAESQRIVLGLNKKYNIYLKNGSKKIKLILSEIHVGQFYLTQAVLKPEAELEVGYEYAICIDSLPQYESFTKYNRVTHKHELITYKVVAEKDTERPQLVFRPKEVKKTLAYYGCGPSIHVVFNNPSKDKFDILVKTTVKNFKTGKETTYYIAPDVDKIKVGHGMCSGAFEFDSSDNYEVEFSFMDASGNMTHWKGERIKFIKPIKVTNYTDE